MPGKVAVEWLETLSTDRLLLLECSIAIMDGILDISL
jgi:hypothetical protein